MTTYRVRVYRNSRATRRFGYAVIRHRGTVQRLLWMGPAFVIFRNAASAKLIRNAS